MGNSQVATKEEARYFTPRELHRIPVSEYDWQRLKELTSPGDKRRNWPSFVRSLSLGVLVSAFFNLIQLKVLVPKTGYPTWVWVIAFVLIVGALIAAAFSQVLASSENEVRRDQLRGAHDELERIEGTFDPPNDDIAPSVATERGAAVAAQAAATVPTNRVSALEEALARRQANTPRRHESGFAVGDNVLHKTFGRGVVKKREGEALIVEFEGGVTKRLLEGYAPLLRVKPPESA